MAGVTNYGQVGRECERSHAANGRTHASLLKPSRIFTGGRATASVHMVTWMERLKYLSKVSSFPERVAVCNCHSPRPNCNERAGRKTINLGGKSSTSLLLASSSNDGESEMGIDVLPRRGNSGKLFRIIVPFLPSVRLRLRSK